MDSIELTIRSAGSENVKTQTLKGQMLSTQIYNKINVLGGNPFPEKYIY